MRDFLWAFVYAASGIAYTVRTERNMRVHLCVAFYVIAAGFITGISRAEWAAVLICIGLVPALGCINTSIERLCDDVHPERSWGIMHAKDTAAGAVMCAAIAAAVVGGNIFFRQDKISAALAFAKAQPVWAAVFVVLLVPAVFFIKGRPAKR